MLLSVPLHISVVPLAVAAAVVVVVVVLSLTHQVTCNS